MSKAAELERLTHDYGREIFARLPAGGPILLTPAWWDDRLMSWTMTEPALKVQLFRFIDSLPLLRTPEQVTRHLGEYLDEAREELPGWLRRGLPWMPRRGLSGRLLAAAAGRSSARLARRFIAGSTLEEALAAIQRLRRQGLAFTVDLLGEATITEAEADACRDEYLHLVEGLARQVNRWPEVPAIDREERGPLPRVNVSVKLSSLYSRFDPLDPEGTIQAVRGRLLPVLRLARGWGAFVNVDMEQYAFKDLTLRIVREVLQDAEFRDWADAGIALQAYLPDTDRDVEELAAWAARRGTPIGVRLVKGAYWDYETVVAAQQDWPPPVYLQKWQSDAAYERLTRVLLERPECFQPAFGSHNVRSLAHALAAADLLGRPRRSLEVQMLYGMGDPIKDVLVKMGRRVRVYTPYGQLLPGMAYLVRRLLENTANESFLRASFTEHVPEEVLLMNPRAHADKAGETPGANGKARLADDRFRNEPLTDFTHEAARRTFAEALVTVRSQLGRTYRPVIGGEEGQTAATFDSVNPCRHSEVIGRLGQASAADAGRAVAAAKAAFPAWRDTEPGARADLLVRAAAVLRRRRFELAAWILLECGKPWREADADVAEAIDFCEYYARQMRRLAVPDRRDLPGEENATFYEPRGVAVVIAPWNFPLAILTGMTAAAVVAGNTAVMKPAEQSSVVGALLMQVWREAGAPAGVVNFLPGVGEEVGPPLVNHPDVAVIAFTGSVPVGLMLNRQAAEVTPGQDHVKRVIAEMGGKNAIIVDEDADLDEAVTGVLHSAFDYAGQKCSACSRAVVLQSLYDRFLDRLVEAARGLKVAPAEDPGCNVPAVIDAAAQRRILAYADKGKAESRLVFAGGAGPCAAEGWFVPPHIFADVPPQAAIAQEEIFGPVLAVLAARDLGHALEIANGTRYALTGGLYSRSPASIERVRREFRVGNLYVNRKITGALVDRQPFGGFKMSGIGSKAGGRDYLLQFLVPRTITENTLRRGFAPPAEEPDAAPPTGGL